MRITLWTTFWVFIIDQLTKYLVVHGLGLITRINLDVLPPYLTFRMAWNRGVNFGFFSGADMRWVLIGLAVVISALVLAWIAREGGNKISLISAGLLVGGAMGNVVDRLLYGAVADFINMSCCGIENPYAFNVADIGVFAGALGLVFFTGRSGGDDAKKEKGRSSETPAKSTSKRDTAKGKSGPRPASTDKGRGPGGTSGKPKGKSS